MSALTFTLPADDLQAAIAAEVRRQLDAMHRDTVSPWLTAAEAAVYLRCPVSRVRRLTMMDRLPVHRDGRRVLYLRDELDAFIRAGGAEAC